MTEWNATQYLKFEAERTQPARDLISRIADTAPNRILDIGCGPGNSTALLQKTFPEAEILGADASDAMLEQARKSHPDLRFVKSVMPDGLSSLPENFDLLFSNACIQWIPGQKELLSALVEKLNPNGVLAVQVPYIQAAPFYQILSSLVQEEPWKKLRSAYPFHNLLPEEYYQLLEEMGCSFTLWETTYFHCVPNLNGVIEWYKGSGLKPYLSRLTPEEQEAFLSALAEKMEPFCPSTPKGTVILKMPRLFFVASQP